jgi:hypothetical protein
MSVTERAAVASVTILARSADEFVEIVTWHFEQALIEP